MTSLPHWLLICNDTTISHHSDMRDAILTAKSAIDRERPITARVSELFSPVGAVFTLDYRNDSGVPVRVIWRVRRSAGTPRRPSPAN